MAAERFLPLAERLAAILADWGSHGPPRRPRNGHTANCPNWLKPVRWGKRCGLCWAEGNGATPSIQVTKEEVPQVRGVNEPPNNISSPVKPPELRSCARCFYPTTDPEGHCS